MIEFTMRRGRLVSDLDEYEAYNLPEETHARALLDHAWIPESEKMMIQFLARGDWKVGKIKDKLRRQYPDIHIKEKKALS